MFQLSHHLPLIERECQTVFSIGGSGRFFIRVAPDYGRQTNRDAQLSLIFWVYMRSSVLNLLLSVGTYSPLNNLM